MSKISSVSGKLATVICLSFLSIGSLGFNSVRAQQPSVDALLAGMTLEQQVAQMFMVSFYGAPMNEPARALLRDWQPGAVVFLPSNLGNPEQVTRLTNDIQTTLIESGGWPALIAVDQEGGIIAHLEDGFTRWPVPMLLTATQDPALAHQFGQALAAELRAVGINMNLAPVADLNTNPDNPIIGRRSFGSEPQLVAPIIAEVVHGMQAGGVLATVKHFPGHGDTDSDSHITLPVVSYSQQFLKSRELIPFQAAIDAGASAVMAAHIVYPNLEPEPGIPASLSTNIVTDLLRTEMNFEGLAITDALDMDAIDTNYTPEAAAIAAINAGHDLILTGAHIGPDTHRRVFEAVVQAVNNGDISRSRIEQSVRRILSVKVEYDFLNWQVLDASTADERIPLSTHAQLVDQLFRNGITVVRGSDQLPLQENSLIIYPATQPSLWRACEGNGWDGLGVSSRPTEQEIAWAASSATSAGQIVVFTQNAADNASQQSLVAALPAERTTVVAMQSPYDLWELPQTSGYMATYSPLTAGYAAICAILEGEIVARGTLSTSLEQPDT